MVSSTHHPDFEVVTGDYEKPIEVSVFCSRGNRIVYHVKQCARLAKLKLHFHKLLYSHTPERNSILVFDGEFVDSFSTVGEVCRVVHVAQGTNARYRDVAEDQRERCPSLLPSFAKSYPCAVLNNSAGKLDERCGVWRTKCKLRYGGRVLSSIMHRLLTSRS